jgi:hypothetical protein
MIEVPSVTWRLNAIESQISLAEVIARIAAGHPPNQLDDPLP